MSHNKLHALFRKIHESFVVELKNVTNQEIPSCAEAFDVFAKSIQIEKLTQRKAKSLDVKDFTNLEIAPNVFVASFADKLSTIELVQTFFVYILILAAIVVKTEDENSDDDDKFILALQASRKGCDYTFETTNERLTQLLENIWSLNKDDVDDEVDDEKGNEEEEPSPLPNIDMSFLEKSKIGKIAKEISDEIDISSIKNPEDVLNFADPKNNVIGDIVSKVGSKIHNKLSNGELNQEDLLSEAFGLLNSFGGKIPGGANLSDILNNPMMKNMMSNMTNQFAKGSNARASVNTSKLRSVSARDRLRTKLNKKKSSSTADIGDV